MLTQEQRDQYQRDGYIVLPDFKSLGNPPIFRAC